MLLEYVQYTRDEALISGRFDEARAMTEDIEAALKAIEGRTSSGRSTAGRSSSLLATWMLRANVRP